MEAIQYIHEPTDTSCKLTFTEKKIFSDYIPENEGLIQYAIKTDVELNDVKIPRALCGVTPHFVIAVSSNPAELITIIDISSIKHLGFSESQEILVRNVTKTLILSGNCLLPFAQAIYLTYQISNNILPSIKSTEQMKFKTPDSFLDQFPPLDVHFSPAQRVQLYYEENSVHLDLNYSQELINILHASIMTCNPILRLNKVPLSMYDNLLYSSPLRPFLSTLGMLNFVTGITISNQKQPHLLFDVIPLISLEFSVFHAPNCGFTNGMNQLYDKIKAEHANIVSWDISGNKLTDFRFFTSILEQMTSDLRYLDISGCKVSILDTAEFLRVLSTCQHCAAVETLGLSGLEIDENGNRMLRSFLALSAGRLHSLTTSEMPNGIESLLSIFTAESAPNLTSLDISHNVISENSIHALIMFLKNTKTLRKLDLSYCFSKSTRKTQSPNSNTTFEPLTIDTIKMIIEAINENTDLNDLTLCLGGLNIHGTDLTLLLKAFLEGDADKWFSLDLSDNNLDTADLKNLTAVFKLMSKLQRIDLSFNFSNSEKNLGDQLLAFVSALHFTHITLDGNSKHVLSTSLYPLLDNLQTFSDLKSLSIKNQEIGDEGLIKLLNCKLEVLKIDGIYPNSAKTDNGILPKTALTSIKTFVQFLTSLSQSKFICDFEFPEKDAEKLLKSIRAAELPGRIEEFAGLQMTIVRNEFLNLANQQCFAPLPFAVTRSLSQVISALSKASQSRFSDAQCGLHSCACQLLCLALPFQRRIDTIEVGGRLQPIKNRSTNFDRDFDWDALKVYHIKAIRTQVLENFPDFNTKSQHNFALSPTFISYLEPDPSLLSQSPQIQFHLTENAAPSQRQAEKSEQDELDEEELALFVTRRMENLGDISEGFSSSDGEEASWRNYDNLSTMQTATQQLPPLELSPEEQERLQIEEERRRAAAEAEEERQQLLFEEAAAKLELQRKQTEKTLFERHLKEIEEQLERTEAEKRAAELKEEQRKRRKAARDQARWEKREREQAAAEEEAAKSAAEEERRKREEVEEEERRQKKEKERRQREKEIQKKLREQEKAAKDAAEEEERQRRDDELRKAIQEAEQKKETEKERKRMEQRVKKEREEQRLVEEKRRREKEEKERRRKEREEARIQENLDEPTVILEELHQIDAKKTQLGKENQKKQQKEKEKKERRNANVNAREADDLDTGLDTGLILDADLDELIDMNPPFEEKERKKETKKGIIRHGPPPLKITIGRLPDELADSGVSESDTKPKFH